MGAGLVVPTRGGVGGVPPACSVNEDHVGSPDVRPVPNSNKAPLIFYKGKVKVTQS